MSRQFESLREDVKNMGQRLQDMDTQLQTFIDKFIAQNKNRKL